MRDGKEITWQRNGLINLKKEEKCGEELKEEKKEKEGLEIGKKAWKLVK